MEFYEFAPGFALNINPKVIKSIFFADKVASHRQDAELLNNHLSRNDECWVGPV